MIDFEILCEQLDKHLRPLHEAGKIDALIARVEAKYGGVAASAASSAETKSDSDPNIEAILDFLDKQEELVRRCLINNFVEPMAAVYMAIASEYFKPEFAVSWVWFALNQRQKDLFSVRRVFPQDFFPAFDEDKDRYKDVLPAEHSRVRGAKGSYVNASYIPLGSEQRDIITAQGPLEQTTEDFWGMVWEQDSPVVVMLTEFEERGVPKCHKYFPVDSVRETFGSITVSLLMEENPNSPFTVRKLWLEKGNETRTIFHLHYKGWPDQGLPDDENALQEVVDKEMAAREELSSLLSGPTVIHCSAGVGRTGMYVMKKQEGKETAEPSLMKLVQLARDLLIKRFYRPGLVQTPQQWDYVVRQAQAFPAPLTEAPAAAAAARLSGGRLQRPVTPVPAVAGSGDGPSPFSSFK